MTNKEFFIKTWLAEMKSTMAAINGLPEDMSKLEYRSNDKARTAAGIIGHMLPHAEALCNAADSFVANEGDDKKFGSVKEAAAYFEKNASQVAEKLKAVDEKTWDEKIVEFKYNGTKLFESQMYDIFWMLMLDIIHHRGQLSTYYRNMGVRNPQIYGPTAEDMDDMTASAK
ncbi:MAG TPA: DinB family protein [Ignavibacteria bacterium]|nr:DinB family protein [Ignavibacteria bacterium]